MHALFKCGELILAIGPKGISANLVGKFCIKAYGNEDRIDLEDGTNHVHIDWTRVKRVEVGSFHGEGMLTFFDGDDTLFKLYLPSGPFPKDVESLAKQL